MGILRGLVFILVSISGTGLSGTGRALAHGVTIVSQTTPGIEIQAQYDSGVPMAQARVAIYAPDAPNTPWLRGRTDDQGRFRFAPDPAQPGNWEVNVRQAGHGSSLTIALPPPGEIPNPEDIPGAGNEVLQESRKIPEEQNQAPIQQHPLTPAQSIRYNSLQRLILIAAVLWGFVGTTLFFVRRK